MKQQNVEIGDKIKFNRLSSSFIGEVSRVRADSVIVKLSEIDAGRLKLDTPLTVVSHKHYEILEKNFMM